MWLPDSYKRYAHFVRTRKGRKMKRINEGLYTEEKEVTVNGRPEVAEFRVYKVEGSPYWAFDCPKLNILGQNVFEKKSEAMEAMEIATKIGFKTMPVKAMMLAISPASKK